MLAYHEAVNRLPETKTFREWIPDRRRPRRTAPGGSRLCGLRPDLSGGRRANLALGSGCAPGRRAARAREATDIRFVASKVSGERDREHVERLVGVPVFASVPLDPAVADAERKARCFDAAPGSDAVAAISRLADQMDAGRLPKEVTSR